MNISNMLAERRASATRDAQARYWPTVESLVAEQEVDLDQLRADLAELDLTPDQLQHDVDTVRRLRAPAANTASAARERAGHAGRAVASAERKVAALKAALLAAEGAASDARIASVQANDLAVRAQRQDQAAAAHDRDAERHLRARGFTGDLGPARAEPAPVEQVRVRARRAVFVEDRLRQNGETFLVGADQVGDPLEVVGDDVPLGMRKTWRVRVKVAHRDSLGCQHAVDDVIDISHEPTSEVHELVDDDSPLRRAADGFEDFQPVPVRRRSSPVARPAEPADLLEVDDDGEEVTDG